jgi:coenzyme F420-reducing hydrogenase gamma subunit
MRHDRKPKLAVFKLTSCDGCQLTLLDSEDELLAIADRVQIAHFVEASREIVRGPYDLSLVEGSISTAADVKTIQAIRAASKVLVAIGACATAGGIQGLRDILGAASLAARVYPRPEAVEYLATSTPVSAHVKVDLELRGCPIAKEQLLDLVGAVLAGRKPASTSFSVCVECKRRGTPCVMVARGIACLGPVTAAGCGAICPAYCRGCYGCFGPKETPGLASLGTVWRDRLGVGNEQWLAALSTFNTQAEPFRKERESHGGT